MEFTSLEAGAASSRGLPRVFWVNQGVNYEKEREGGYVRAPKKNAGGGEFSHWKRVSELRPGDLIVHYYAKMVRALGRVTAEAFSTENSEWQASVEYFPLQEPIAVEEVIADYLRLIQPPSGPITVRRSAKQGYLWDFCVEGLALLRNLTHEQWPQWADAPARDQSVQQRLKDIVPTDSLSLYQVQPLVLTTQEPLTSHGSDVALVEVIQPEPFAAGNTIPGSPLSGSASPKPVPSPQYPDAQTRLLIGLLEGAKARKRRLQASGANTSQADREILSLRRQLREGGQLRAGDSLGHDRYLLIEAIGRGGFGNIWKAYDRVSQAIVAIKVLHTNLAGDPERRDRFFRGARRMAELQHPAVVRVFEQHGEDGGFFFFVMEYVAGGNLRQAVLEGVITPDKIVPIILRVGEALAVGHSKGIIHRDVKPANILLDEQGHPLLTDFDLVGAVDTTGGTRTGTMGTIVYAAPECLERPQDADARADVYGLGMTALFGVYGADLPFHQIMRSPESFLDQLPCPAPIKTVLRRATSLERAERYKDAGEFTAELQHAQSALESRLGMQAARSAAPQDTSIRILHLSDLHVDASDDPVSLRQPLVADLRNKLEGLGVERLDYLVISGDLTNRAAPREFERAYEFVSGLIEEFALTAQRCIIVPGNHDLDWKAEVYRWVNKRDAHVSQLAPESFLEAGPGYLIRDDARYPERFKNFSEHFYQRLIQKPYPLAPEEQCIPFLFSDDGLQVLAMNSAWEIDEHFRERSSISEKALARGLAAANQDLANAQAEGMLAKDTRILRLAVWHHPITGNEKIQADAFMGQLRQAGVQLCLHGHVHEERAELLNYLDPARRLHVIGGGSFGAPTHERPESVPRLYNLLEVRRDLQRFRVHTRCRRKQGGAWEGWAVWPGEGPGIRRTHYDVEL